MSKKNNMDSIKKDWLAFIDNLRMMIDNEEEIDDTIKSNILGCIDNLVDYFDNHKMTLDETDMIITLPFNIRSLKVLINKKSLIKNTMSNFISSKFKDNIINMNDDGYEKFCECIKDIIFKCEKLEDKEVVELSIPFGNAAIMSDVFDEIMESELKELTDEGKFEEFEELAHHIYFQLMASVILMSRLCFMEYSTTNKTDFSMMTINSKNSRFSFVN